MNGILMMVQITTFNKHLGAPNDMKKYVSSNTTFDKHVDTHMR